MIISEGTRRLTCGLFDYQDLGRISLKGLTSPVQAWQVLGRIQKAKFWEVQATMGLARLWRDQGKHAEAHDILAAVYQLVHRRLRHAGSEGGQVVGRRFGVVRVLSPEVETEGRLLAQTEL